MSRVLSGIATPTAPVFAGYDGTPLYVDRATGRVYYLNSSGAVVDLLTGQVAGTGLWEDLRFPFHQTMRGANAKPDFDETNIGLLFPQNDAAEKVHIIGQLPHSWVEGSVIKPHIHWQQSQAAVPVWKLDYKWFNRGAAVPANFTTVTSTTESFTYTSGNLHQRSYFADIDGTGKTVSSILLMKFYRQDNVVTGDVLGFEFDIHYQVIRLGTVSG